MSLQELPLDVLLELVKLLCVGDLISFLSTCRVTRKLEFHRTLWLDALVRIQEVEMQPVALPNGQALDSLAKANRLMNNFKSDNPRPVRIRSLEPKIFCIPGTNLAVSHVLGSVSCWDILASKRVACLELPNSKFERKHFLSDSILYQFSGFGIFQMPYPVRQQANEFHDRLHSRPLSHCLLFGRRLYLFHIGRTAAAQSCPFPSVRLRNMAIYPPLIFAPDYGVFAVTYRDFEWEGRGCFMVHFWPRHADDEGNIDIGQGVFYEHKDRILQMAVGQYLPRNNGFLETGEPYLGLLHFRATPAPHTTFRRLDIGNLSLRLVLVLNQSGTITAISYV
ncbi:hypothetical protein B0H13DRAFT_2130484 [Mycena leptocephala]|nr:hypothetical protein B0H13DRAFT_2130484 [Mycena leptocephala]